jgi:hypothetical protein
MSSAYWYLSDTAQKEVSRLSTLINKQKDIIKREQAVQNNKGDTYICKRAKVVLEATELKITIAEDEYKRCLKELERKYEEDKKTLKLDLEAYISKCESKMNVQQSIINDEANRKSDTVIRAEAEIESLEKKLENFMKCQMNSNVPGNLEKGATQISEKKDFLCEGSNESASPDLSDWEQLQKMEKELALLRVGRPPTNYALPVNNTEYGLISELGKKKQVKSALSRVVDVREERVLSEES